MVGQGLSISRDNKHILQKIEFVGAKFSRSGEKKKKQLSKQTLYELEGLSISRKECPCWAGPGDC